MNKFSSIFKSEDERECLIFILWPVVLSVITRLQAPINSASSLHHGILLWGMFSLYFDLLVSVHFRFSLCWILSLEYFVQL